MEAYHNKNKTFFENGIEEVKLLQVFDGDTASFILQDGRSILCRFLGINAPECTKKVEPYGKEALNFVKTRLENANIIVIEADTDKPELDATHNRYLAYVWYGENYPLKLLNLEIVEASLAKLLIMNNVTKYTETLEAAYKRVKHLGINIHGSIDDVFNMVKEKVSIANLLEKKEYYDAKTVKVEGIVSRTLSKSFFIVDEDKGIYVYNTYYDISKINPGDKVRFVAQFSIDNIYDCQLTNIRGLEIISHDNNIFIPYVDDASEINKYLGMVVKLKQFYCLGVENIRKYSKAYYVDGLDGKTNIKIKMSESVNTNIKKSAFNRGMMYDMIVGVISYRKSFEEEKSASFVFCNDLEKDLEKYE